MRLFSVVIPAYNASGTLAETLDAMLGQRFDDWECIVVDDGSTDDTRAIAESYAGRDSRVQVIAQANRGTGGAYNTGVSAATAEWVTICSADDVLLPTHLESMAHAIEANPAIDILSCNGYYLRSDGSRTLVYPGRKGAVSRSWSLEDLFDRCFYSVGACYRRSLFERVGGYREDIYGEDYDFWLRAMAAGARHVYLPEALTLHRVSEGQKSTDRRRAYESDIRSITTVVESGTLSEQQAGAAQRAIRFRTRLISEIESPDRLANRLRRILRPVVSWVRTR